MTTEEALAELEIEWPWGNKLSCPKHSDSDPSLHLYPDDRGWYCFSCLRGGDGWALLSHYLDVPVADLMRERGVSFGPRPRSRYEQLGELESRARELRWDFHLRLREIWGDHMPRFFRQLRDIEGRVDAVYGDGISARYFPEDLPPYHMELIVNDLEEFYRGELTRQLQLREMVDGL